jgi:hypothetical protein
MSATKAYEPLISFYITHTCGLACPNCASYNNFRVKGHLEWEKAKSKVYKWGEILDIGQISIIGGEPITHPDIDSWVLGISDAFKDCKDKRIFTGLTGDKLIRFKDKILNWMLHDVIVQISCHDKNWWEDSKRAAEEILLGIDYIVEEVIDGGNFPLKRIDYKTQDHKMLFCILEQYEFFPMSTKKIENGTIVMHNNDNIKAHTACHCKDCHYIVDGDMYKCVLTGCASMWLEQLPVEARVKALLEEASTSGLDPFVDGYKSSINDPVPQCSLCPVEGMEKLIPIWPVPAKKPVL